jgi:hypothetical protein
MHPFVHCRSHICMCMCICLYARVRACANMHSCEAGDIRLANLSPEEGMGGKLKFVCNFLSDVSSCLSELDFGLSPKQWPLQKDTTYIKTGSLLLCGTSKRLREWERESRG